MVILCEIVLLIGLFVGGSAFAILQHRGNALFMQAIPACAFWLAVLHWYYLLIFHYRSVTIGRFRQFLYHGGVTVLVAAVLSLVFPDHARVLKAVYVDGQISAAAFRGGPAAAWASWAQQALADGTSPSTPLFHALLLSIAIGVFFVVLMVCRNGLEQQLRSWAQQMFLRHQNRVASFLSEEEEVKRAFLVYEGYWYPLKILFERPSLILWTDARVIIMRELRGAGPPLSIRSISVVSCRAVRASERFLRPLGLSMSLELLNRQRLRLWILSRTMADEMGNALASSVQQLYAIQGAYDGPVMRHVCPFCFAEAGKGERTEEACPVCHRSLRPSTGQQILTVFKYLTMACILVAIGAWLFGPSMRAICRGTKGERLVLEGHRLRVFNSSGRVIKVGVLPAKLRAGGGGTFLSPNRSNGVLVGGPSGVYLWTGSKFNELLAGPSHGSILGAASLADGRIAIVAYLAGQWVLHLKQGNNLTTVPLSFLPISPPRRLLGALGEHLLFSMENGGVARYNLKGHRAGWLVQPSDSGEVIGGAILTSRSVRLVDLEELAPWTFSSGRPDIVNTIEIDGTITNTSSLGTRRLPLFVSAIVPSTDKAVRPEFVCRGGGKDLWLLDTYSARLVRIMATGTVVDDFCRGRLASWLTEIRYWHVAYWLAIIGGILFCSLAIVGQLLLVISTRRSSQTEQR